MIKGSTLTHDDIENSNNNFLNDRNLSVRTKLSLIELLLSPDCELTAALCEIVLIPEEGRTFAEALVDLFYGHNKLTQLMEWAIAKEITSNSSSSTLFRGACEATKLWPAIYFRIGVTYLRNLIGPLVKDITTSSQSFEIDPNKAEKGVDVRDNMKKVLSITTEFLSQICDSIDRCPGFLRYIFYYAKKEVTKKFPQASSIIVGVFFFLRYMIPAIVTPTQYGLILEPPSMEAQRGLILISKLLQNLSNGIEFDESHEKYMSELNKFLAEKMSVVQTFFNKLADHPNPSDPGLSVSVEQEHIAFQVIVLALRENKDKVFALLKPETKKTVSIILSEIETSATSASSSGSKLGTLKKKVKERRDEKTESMTKMEDLLSDEIRYRKNLERKMATLEEHVMLQLKLLEMSMDQKLQDHIEKGENNDERLLRLEKIMKSFSEKIANSPAIPRSNRAASTSKIPH